MSVLHLLHLESSFIFDQLQLEERLLRTTDQNWCLINEGSSSPAIVMGISGKSEESIHQEELLKNTLPVIRRFSGGGTVVVDRDTLFVTFIFQKNVHTFPAFPESIMRWSGELYQNILPIPEFGLYENDYVIGEKKCGGNAQYITKERWLHHTSFLWDFKRERMNTLRHPKKAPKYRENREHSDFLCRLKDFIPSRRAFIDPLKRELEKRYIVKELSLEELPAIKPYRQETMRCA
jgi:lipoate---protein ligase